MLPIRSHTVALIAAALLAAPSAHAQQAGASPPAEGEPSTGLPEASVGVLIEEPEGVSEETSEADSVEPPTAGEGVAEDAALPLGAALPSGEVVVDGDPAMRDPMPLPPAEMWLADPTTIFSAVDVSLEDFLWVARPVVVFAGTAADPAFQQQMSLLMARMDALAERDVVVMTDTDPSANSDLRQRLRPRGFMVAIVDKDGRVATRRPFPWDVRELTRSIDRMPLRRQEIQDRRSPNL